MQDGQTAADPQGSGHEWSRIVQQRGVTGVQVLQRACLETHRCMRSEAEQIDSSLMCELSITQASPSSSCVRRPASHVCPCACCWRYWDEWRIHSTLSYRTKRTLPERERNTLFILYSISELIAVCSVFILQKEIMKGMQNTNRQPELPWQQPAASVQKLMRGNVCFDLFIISHHVSSNGYIHGKINSIASLKPFNQYPFNIMFTII